MRAIPQNEAVIKIIQENNSKLTDAAKEARKAYRREWAKKNPDKVKEHQARYWNKKAKELETDEPKAV